METLHFILLTLLASFAYSAPSPQLSSTLAGSEPSTCDIDNCLEPLFEQGYCNYGADLECLCTNEPYLQVATKCLGTACSSGLVESYNSYVQGCASSGYTDLPYNETQWFALAGTTPPSSSAPPIAASSATSSATSSAASSTAASSTASSASSNTDIITPTAASTPPTTSSTSNLDVGEAVTPTPTPTPTPMTTAHTGGLTTSDNIAIGTGVGVPVGIAALTLLVRIIFLYRKHAFRPLPYATAPQTIIHYATQVVNIRGH